MYKIRIDMHDDGASVSCTINGKHVDMTDRVSALNVAGELARIATRIVKHFLMQHKQLS